jgi:sugar lactone lactonase YvrE
MSAEAIACTTPQTLLGEGIRWDARRDDLLGVDILDGCVFRGRVGDDGDLTLVHEYRLPTTVGAVAPIEGDEGWLVAAGRGVVHLALDGTVRPIAELAPEEARMNDAACDPQGRFWAGTKAHDNRPGGGALYRLDGDGRTETMLDGLTISNGLGWSLDNATMYLVDSTPGLIHAFDFDPDRGTMSNGRVLVDVPDDTGSPDGMTVDSTGDLWVAIWGGGQVHRYSPDGELLEAMRIPAEQTTSCGFGGPGLHTLYVSTATEDWSDEQRRADPGAGIVYRLDTDATGRPAEPYRPDPAWWTSVISSTD